MNAKICNSYPLSKNKGSGKLCDQDLSKQMLLAYEKDGLYIKRTRQEYTRFEILTAVNIECGAMLSGRHIATLPRNLLLPFSAYGMK
jgi:hypothetical protein